MTPDQIPLARRIVACGLPMPNHSHSKDGDIVTVYWKSELEALHYRGLFVGDTFTWNHSRLMYACVATETGPELLPVLDDFALLGWLITELERATGGHVDVRQPEHEDYNWRVLGANGQELIFAYSRLEALIAALEAAKGAA